MKTVAPVFIFVLGGLLCIIAGHTELAGLGTMIAAGCLEIAWNKPDAP